ncbi:hypothetical protein LCGC14_0810870 [marine sediment metagenome]|uniref:Uncharacterized protein n=1 Tax=marine sediment metagenome TaxID=412755 RepID=A0A0F9SU70_9ZZZZ
MARAGQTFHFLGFVWNIDPALEMVKRRAPNVNLYVPHWVALLGMIETNKAWATNVDLSSPVILVPLPDGIGDLIIDGWHRVLKAHVEEKDYLRAHLLSYQEAREVCIEGDYRRRRPKTNVLELRGPRK